MKERKPSCRDTIFVCRLDTVHRFVLKLKVRHNHTPSEYPPDTELGKRKSCARTFLHCDVNEKTIGTKPHITQEKRLF